MTARDPVVKPTIIPEGAIYHLVVPVHATDKVKKFLEGRGIDAKVFGSAIIPPPWVFKLEDLIELPGDTDVLELQAALDSAWEKGELT